MIDSPIVNQDDARGMLRLPCLKPRAQCENDVLFRSTLGTLL